MVRGCIHNSLCVDGKQEINMTDEERQVVLKTIFEHLKAQDFNYVLQDLVETFGEYECDDRPCKPVAIMLKPILGRYKTTLYESPL
jgi:hypothetical protein